MLESHFSAQTQEPRLYAAWEQSGAFKPKADPEAEAFSIVIPPPNVTGSLHIGHALNCTLQDILCRFERMRGKSVLWQPGLDHAGIATQMVVESQMAQSGTHDSRRAMGREKFLERVWSWKEESGGTINGQLKRLGASCDWSRERFTMDEGLSAAVRKVFVQLYKEGLVYRDKRLVNWDPHFETAVSDLEVVNEERAGHFWHLRYPLENGQTYQFPIAFDEAGVAIEFETRDYIAIATTRPETILGDGAVAVHPSDLRYRDLVGKRCILPLTGRLIPIIADDYPDPEFGSGAVKITGAHDFNDYKVARRHDIELYILFDTKGRTIDADYIPEAYRGLDRFEARKQIVADIDTLGLLERVEDKPIMQPLGERSDVVIEPMLTDQWYVDAAKLAVNALKAVESGETKFVPESWTATYYQWLRHIEPWCISRQLWWGHRIPAWYDRAGNIFVEETEAEALAAASTMHGRDVDLVQDEDVLDTWFSSALWPFSTLGWPTQTPELERFYPTSTLVTMFDIIFFWVARMMMFGCHFTGKAPFSTVVIHSRVVDENGKKMSKSKGNIIDPTVLIETYGADALRFTLAIAAGPGRDIRMSDKRVEGYRNFGTKVWNAARFAQMNECTLWDAYDPKAVNHPVNRWIVSELTKATHGVEAALSAHRFDEAAQTNYAFVWGVFCDLYLELVKPLLNGEDEAAKAETRKTVAWVLDQILKILHPFMPFVTEELWEKTAEFGPKRSGMLMREAWPTLSLDLIDEAATAEVGWVVDLVTGLRSLRSETNVPASAKVAALLIGASKQTAQRLERYQAEIDRLARLEYSVVADAAPPGSVTFVLGEAIVAIPLAGVLDIDAEKLRLGKEIARCIKEIETVARKLDNPGFVAKAPVEVIEEQRERLASYAGEKQKYEAALARLG
ncbi:valine--tRNA ligase [Candidatus Phycosocius spiralis]|uniref:Valine--tRNA ligase n=1 Tax=Candidatus Phycosocius spiralis TaxID=2815099 RepID=A0ABQ4PYT7_9PROT|nr:valine--tRNA ligase [Candidatus Phycosocius spiralis]GIU68091.1 valine--tRNA ligase [Candidatus Phycosocius spiralis]